jgi:anti-sigma B factor antagonist
MGFAPQFTTRIESRNGVARIALEGELDMVTVPVLSDHLARFEADGVVGIMLDLRGLTFVDCSGLRIFLAARDRSKASGHRFILIGVSPAGRRLFELTRTQFLLDEQEAVSLLDRFTQSGADRAVQSAVVDRGAYV